MKIKYIIKNSEKYLKSKEYVVYPSVDLVVDVLRDQVETSFKEECSRHNSQGVCRRTAENIVVKFCNQTHDEFREMNLKNS